MGKGRAVPGCGFSRACMLKVSGRLQKSSHENPLHILQKRRPNDRMVIKIGLCDLPLQML